MKKKNLISKLLLLMLVCAFSLAFPSGTPNSSPNSMIQICSDQEYDDINET